MYVARLTATRAIAQAIVPGTAAPRPNGRPISFQKIHTEKPLIIPAIMPAFVAFLQKSAANAGRPAAAA